MDTIEPSTYDVIVASSGVTECLIASALLKAGKSVLLIDETDVYGADHASFTLPGLLGSTDASLNPHAATPNSSEPQQLPDGLQLIRWKHHGLSLQGVSSWYAPGQQADSVPTRGFILDLSPKVLYQAEPLVDILVRTRAHNYLEFKAVDSSFIYHNGALRTIPASRANIFKDKTLSLGGKRTLMSFLNNCMEAFQGKGPLASVLQEHSSQPLSTLLASEGLSALSRDVVLYGVAMQLACNKASNSHDSHNITPATESTGMPGSASRTYNRTTADDITAAEGLRLLKLYTESLGRFGTAGAFMTPSYGCGSIPEALVRHCAVKGAITALRQAIAGLLVQTPNQTTDPSTSTEGIYAVKGVLLGSGQVLTAKEAVILNSRRHRDLVSELQHQLQNDSNTQADHAVPHHQPTVTIARCIAVLDAPLIRDQQIISLVIPPNSPGINNVNPVFGLMLSAATGVVPAGRFLLYLTTMCPPESSTSAQDILQSVLQCLASLADATPSNDSSQDTSYATLESEQQSQQKQQESNPPQKPSVLQAHFYTQQAHCSHAVLSSEGNGISGATLEQNPNLRPEPDVSGKPPQDMHCISSSSEEKQQACGPFLNLVCCPGASAGLNGYLQEVSAAQALLSKHFPGVAWLLDEEKEPQSEAHESGAAGKDSEPVKQVDDEDLAIDELQAALASLTNVVSTQ